VDLSKNYWLEIRFSRESSN